MFIRTKLIFLFLFILPVVIGNNVVFSQEKPEIFVQLGHSTSDIKALAVTPDGKFIVSGASDHTLKLWDITSGKEIRTFRGLKDFVNSVAISPDGRFVVASSRALSKNEKSIIMWDINTGKEVWGFGPEYGVYALAFTPDGKFIITDSGGFVNSLALLDATTGREIRKFGDPGIGAPLAITPDGRFIIAKSSGWRLKLLDIFSGKEIRTFNGQHHSIITSIAISHDGRYAASGSWDKTLKLWEISTGREIRTMKGHIDNIMSVAFTPDGRYILSGPEYYHGDMARLWSTDSGSLVRTFDLPRDKRRNINAITTTPDGKYAVMGNGNEIVIWDTRDPKMGYKTLRGYASSVSNVGFVPVTNKYIVSGGRLWDLTTGRPLRTFEWITKIGGITVSPDGKYVFAQSGDMPLSLWEIETGKVVKEIYTRELLKAAAFTSDGKFVLTGESDGSIKLWDITPKPPGILIGEIVKGSPAERAKLFPGDFILAIDDIAVETWSQFISIIQKNPGKTLTFSINRGNEIFKVSMKPEAVTIEDQNNKKHIVGRIGITLGGEKYIKAFQGHKKEITSLAISSDGKYAVSAAQDEPARLWDLDTGKEIRSLEKANLVDISQDGHLIITSGGSPPIKLWDRATGKVIRALGDELASTSAWIYKLAFTPDARFAVSSGGDNTMRLWDVNQGKEVLSFKGHGGFIWSININHDGTRLLSGSSDGTTRLWDIATGKELVQFITFTDGEWIAITPEGYFNASPNGARHLNVRVGNKVYSIDNFYEKFFNPVYVASVLQGKKVETVADIRKGILTPPDVRITSPEPNTSFSTDTITITVSAKDTGGGIDEIRLYHNGKAIGEDQRAVKIVPKGNEVIKNYTVTLVDGINTFRATGFSKDRTESNPYELIAKLTAPSKDISLYVFAVGINKYRNPALNLNYAEPDARAIAEFFREKGKTLFKSVEITEIYNEHATKENISSKLKQLERTNPQDAVLIYLAGHGENIGDRWYFIPHELTYPEREEDIKSKSISSDEFSALIKNIKAQKILFLIDACKSGAALVAFRGFEDRKALSQLSRATGVHVIAASTKDQFASEVKDLGHGVFTYTLLEGLKGKASGGTETITVRKLMGYVEERLPDITKRYKQEPQFPVVDSRGMDFPLIMVK